MSCTAPHKGEELIAYDDYFYELSCLILVFVTSKWHNIFPKIKCVETRILHEVSPLELHVARQN